MKYLTIIRHAKSSWAMPGLADHDRPLNDRGLQAAPAMGSFLHRTYFGGGEGDSLLPPPDRLVTSTAARALGTAKIMREIIGVPVESLILDSRLYLAEASTILEVVQQLDETWQHAMLFGHNPGLHEFADRVLARAHVPKVPTCTALLLALPQPYWGLAEWGQAQLVGYITPKTLARRFPDSYGSLINSDDDD